MAVINEKIIKDKIKQNDFDNIYLITGDEPYLKKHYANLLISKLVKKEFAVFNLHHFEGEEVSLMNVSQVAESLPMMDERICIVIKDYPVNELNQNAAAELSSLLSDIPETTVLIFWSQRESYDKKKNEKYKEFHSMFDKFGTVIELDKRSNTDIVALIIKGAKQRKCTIDRKTANYLIECVGNDLNTILGELEKLCVFASGGEITNEIIDSHAVKSIEASVFDLSKALLSEKKDIAFNVLDKLFKQKMEAYIISGALLSAFVDMYRVKVFITSGFNEMECMKYYNYSKFASFKLTKAKRDCSKISIEQLRSCLDVIGECDKKIKGFLLPNNLVLEETLVKLILILNGEKA